MPRLRPSGPVFCCLAALFVGSCSSADYFRRADRETEGIIARKAADVPNMPGYLDVRMPPEPYLEKFSRNGKTVDFLGEKGAAEKDASVVVLADALELAVVQNREYRNRKELLYLQALDLTLGRHEFAPIFDASGNVQRNSLPSQDDPDAGLIAAGINRIVRDNTLSGTSVLSFTQLQKLGTRLSADLTSDFLKFLNGDMRALNSSRFVAGIAQPLLKGAGYRATTETLTTAEHDLLYAIRDFARFRKEFSVQVATAYYEILRARDSAANAWAAYQGFLLSLEREEGFFDEGQTSLTELGLIKQATYQAESRWVDAVRDYEQLLDQFKIDLGVSIDSNIVLADYELDKLKIIRPELPREKAAEVAIYTRLDLQNNVGKYADTARRIKVSKQDLLPSADFVADIEIIDPIGNQLPGLDFSTRDWSAGLNLDLNLDKKEERNLLRAAFIAHQRSARELELAIDEVKQDIYNDWRALDQAERQYQIAQSSVELAAKRVEEQLLRMEIGQGTARDLVDAQNDLTDSQNQRTAALVNHTTARLNFWRDMGVLFINEDGSWIKKLEQEPANHEKTAKAGGRKERAAGNGS